MQLHFNNHLTFYYLRIYVNKQTKINITNHGHQKEKNLLSMTKFRKMFFYLAQPEENKLYAMAKTKIFCEMVVPEVTHL